MEASKEGRLLAVAAEQLLKHGYGRIKMNDLARVAGISRAALYQMFNSKEQIFLRIFSDLLAALLDEIRAGLDGRRDPGEGLRFAFEVWAVKNFDLTRRSPEARELLDLGLEFSRDVFETRFQEFEALLVPLLPQDGRVPPSELAHILGSALRGLKKTARDARELRALIEGLLVQCGLVGAPQDTSPRT
jgi:AcrR family transcriptional regulator